MQEIKRLITCINVVGMNYFCSQLEPLADFRVFLPLQPSPNVVCSFNLSLIKHLGCNVFETVDLASGSYFKDKNIMVIKTGSDDTGYDHEELKTIIKSFFDEYEEDFSNLKTHLEEASLLVP